MTYMIESSMVHIYMIKVTKMYNKTLLLLQTIWKDPSWRDHLFADFIDWVQKDISRNDAIQKLQRTIRIDMAKQFYPQPFLHFDQINWRQCVEFFCLCYYNRRFRRPLLELPSDELWNELTDEENRGPLSPHEHPDRPIKDTVPAPLVPLENILLSLGGTKMIYRSEPDLIPLLKRGEVFHPPVELVSGELGACHTNTTHFWSKHKDVLAIATGYALSEDGFWRQHSWLLDKKKRDGQIYVIETTMKREMYFGFVLTEDESETFCQMYY